MGVSGVRSAELRSQHVQEHGNLLALVTLELDDLAKLIIVHNGAVACKLLLERLEQLLRVVLCIHGQHPPSAARAREPGLRTLRQTLQRGKRLAAVPLLDADVHVVLHLRGLLLLLGLLLRHDVVLTDVCKGVWSRVSTALARLARPAATYRS